MRAVQAKNPGAVAASGIDRQCPNCGAFPAESATVNGEVRLSHAGIQPMAAADVASGVARAAEGQARNGVVEVAGPERWGLDDLVRTGLEFRGDERRVVTDPTARYFGALLGPDTLLPGPEAQLAETRFEEWLPENPVPRRH